MNSRAGQGGVTIAELLGVSCITQSERLAFGSSPRPSSNINPAVSQWTAGCKKKKYFSQLLLCKLKEKKMTIHLNMASGVCVVM